MSICGSCNVGKKYYSSQSWTFAGKQVTPGGIPERRKRFEWKGEVRNRTSTLGRVKTRAGARITHNCAPHRQSSSWIHLDPSIHFSKRLTRSRSPLTQRDSVEICHIGSTSSPAPCGFNRNGCGFLRSKTAKKGENRG